MAFDTDDLPEDIPDALYLRPSEVRAYAAALDRAGQLAPLYATWRRRAAQE